MKISEITDGADTIEKQIERLKERPFPAVDIEKVQRELNPAKHEIFNKTKRPDKTVVEDVPGSTTGETRTRTEYKARIAFALQKFIVRIAAQFLFGNPVKILSIHDQSELADQLEKALKKILIDNKEISLNKRIARAVMSSLEVAEHWYAVESSKPHNRYGFPSKFKIRSSIWSPLNGDSLYPLFDETGDMIAFSREYTVEKQEKKFTYFETYTAEEKVIWVNEGKEWVELSRVPNPIGKIPVVYSNQEETEWSDGQWIIERLETLASNHADTNDYHSSPKILVSGKILSFAAKGESGAILEMEQGGEAKYMSWDNAPESVRMEWSNLLEMLSTITQTPKAFFESLDNKAGTAISGVGLKMKFLSAHLKVEDKKEIFDSHIVRRYSIISSLIGEINNALKPAIDETEFEPEITPYMIGDETALISNLSTATGGKPVMSQRTAIEALGYAKDVDAELLAITDETLGGLEE